MCIRDRSYNLARLMNQKMGGAYTDAELNTVIAPYLAQLGGEYETITGPKKRRKDTATVSSF